MIDRLNHIKHIAKINDEIIEGKIKNVLPVGFNIGNTYIHNPLLDEAGKVPIDNPDEYYGKSNIDKFIEDGSKIINT